MIIIMISLCYWNMWKFSRKNTLENLGKIWNFPDNFSASQHYFCHAHYKKNAHALQLSMVKARVKPTQRQK